MTANYTLTSQRLNGQIELQFFEGCLITIKMILKQPLNEVQFRTLVTLLPQHESELYKLEGVGLTATLDAPANQKIALFCRLYEAYKGVKYRVSPADSGKIKLVKVDEDMLVFYFNSANFLFRDKHSISNLAKYYNELLAEIAIASKPKSSLKYPDHFDQVFQNKLTTKECPGYWNHLRALGYEPKYARTGELLDWIKSPPKSVD